MSHQFPAKNTDLSLQSVDEELPAGARNRHKSRYAYFETVSNGARSIVQTCRDLHLGRTVCYKSLAPHLSTNPLQQKLFLREARITAMLEHPNTVPVYDICRDIRGHYYFTMPQIVGSTFDEMLDSLQSNDQIATEWDLDNMVDILIRVCHALNYAHNRGVYHCNLTPKHIVSGAYGEVHVLDWGLARLKNVPLEKVQAKLPDPLYMSPEQAAGGVIDPRSDIYSVGAILFELLTLESLDWGSNLQEMLAEGSATPKETPTQIEAICLRCVAKHPDHRFQSISELIHALHYWRRQRQDSLQLAGSY